MTLRECFKRYLCCTCVVRRRTIASRLVPAMIQLMVIAVVWYIFQARANLNEGLASILPTDGEGRTLCSPGDYSKGRTLSLADIMSTNANVVLSSRSEQPQYLNVEVIVRDLQTGTLVSYEVGTPVITTSGAIERVKADDDYEGHDDVSHDTLPAAAEGGVSAEVSEDEVKPLDVQPAVNSAPVDSVQSVHTNSNGHVADVGSVNGVGGGAVPNGQVIGQHNPMVGQSDPSMSGVALQEQGVLLAGINAGVNPGVNAGVNAGVNPGINPGVNAGLNSGVNPGANPVVNPGVNAMPAMQQVNQVNGQFGQQTALLHLQNGNGQFNQLTEQLNQQPGQFNQQTGQLNQQIVQLNQQTGQLNQQAGQLNQQAGQLNQQAGLAQPAAGDLLKPPAQQPGSAAGLGNQDAPPGGSVQAGTDEHGPLFAEGLNERMMQFKMELYGKASDTIEVDRTSIFLMNNENRCDGEPEVDILFLIHAQPQSDDRRTAIRTSFVRSDLFKDARIAHVFLLGRTNSPNFQKNLDTEHAQFGDIVQGDFLDKPENATRKAIMGFKWTMAYCASAKYVMKIDEDVFVDSDKLLHGMIPVMQGLVGPRTIMCYLTTDATVPRSGPKAFSKELFPHSSTLRPHCKSFAVLMTRGVVSSLLATARHAPYVASEGLYVFGVLPYLAGHIDLYDVGNKRAFHDFGQETVNCYRDKLGDCPLVASKAFSSRFTDLWTLVTERMASPQDWTTKGLLWDINSFRMQF